MTVVTEFKWKVGGFTRRFIDDDEFISSEEFSLKDMPGTNFHLYISGISKNIYLYRNKIGRKEEIKLSTKFWLESGGIKFKECVKRCVFINSDSEYKVLPNKFADLKTLITGDSLTICLKLKLGHSIEGLDDEEPKMKEIEMDEPDIYKQFALNVSTLHSEGHSDLTIQAGGKEFKAYKNVLMSHSEVFKRMLSCSNLIEAQTSLVKIENAGADVIEALVRWMHFLTVDNLDNISEDLYKIAHKYQIGPLMVENLASRIILAYIYEAEDLKSYVVRFVQKDPKNFSALISSDEWLDFANENREMAKQIGIDIGKQFGKASWSRHWTIICTYNLC